MKKSYLLYGCLFFTLLANGQNVFTDDYAPGVSFVGFGGATNAVTVDNTQAQAGTSSLKVLVTSGYTGGAFAHSTPQNLSTYNAVSFWVKASKNATLNVSGLGNNGATTVFQAEYNSVPLTSTWAKVIIPIPDAAKLTAENGLFHFAEGSDEGAYTIWMDEIKYETLGSGVIGTPTAAFATETLNKFVGDVFSPVGVACSFPINSVTQNLSITKAYLTLSSSNPAVVSIGAGSVCNAVGVGSATITGKLGAVNAAGTITCNVASASGGAPATAAPAPPSRSAGDVIGLFTGTYTEVPGTDWNPGWGQSTVVTDETIAGNVTKKYANLNYQGVQFASPINASAMSKLHIDVWTPNCTAFDVFLINTSPATVEQKVTLTPTLSGWNSFDIDLSQYTSIALNNIGQFKFVGTPFGSSTVYWDNLYFYRGSPLPVTLLNYSAAKNANGGVSIKWSTTAEINNDHFLIERSRDGREFVALEKVLASTGSGINHYSIQDGAPLRGINYYRLTQVDRDGRKKVYDVKVVNIQRLGAGVIVYPNPVANNLINVAMPETADKNVAVQLISLNGSVVYSALVRQQGEQLQIKLPNKPLPGIYVLKLEGNQPLKVTIN